MGHLLDEKLPDLIDGGHSCQKAARLLPGLIPFEQFVRLIEAADQPLQLLIG